MDTAGNVYVADTSNHAIRKITPDGEVHTVVGDPYVYLGGYTCAGYLPAYVASPLSVAVDGAGNLYITTSTALLKVEFY